MGCGAFILPILLGASGSRHSDVSSGHHLIIEECSFMTVILLALAGCIAGAASSLPAWMAGVGTILVLLFITLIEPLFWPSAREVFLFAFAFCFLLSVPGMVGAWIGRSIDETRR
jgi:hypothetical protein